MKKVLSLVLVLAMVLGSVSLVFAKTEYKDAATITNKEAVDVLSELKVLEGDANGFRPNDTLTRAEGAAIAARLLLGRTDADKLTASAAPFKDVPATHWAAGYIAYCVSQGLLNGYGDGNFGPEDTLTVAQFGKMMLCALGYDAAIEGLQGASFESNTASLMVKAKISVPATGNCTRETAAQLGLNTLKADEVQYASKGVSVNAGGTQVTVAGSSATKVDGTKAGVPGNYGPDTTDAVKQFMEDHFTKLTYTPGVGAKLGRPDGYQWKNANIVIANGNTDDSLVATYTTKVTQGTMYTTLGKDIVNAVEAGNATVERWLDGANALAATSGAGVMTANNIAKQDSSTAVAGSATGVQTEVYVDKNNNVTIVEYKYYAVKATAKYDADDEKLNVKAHDGSSFDIKAEDFAIIKDAAKNDWFYVVYDNGVVAAANIVSIEKATVVSGTIDSAVLGESATVDGTKYSFAVATDWDAVGALSAKSDIDLILDKNGFVAAYANTDVKKNYAYISEVATSGSLTTSGQKAGMYFTDGTYSENTVKNATSASPAGLYSYTVDGDGKYKLTAVAGSNLGTAEILGKKVDFASGAAVKADDKTVFVVIKNPTSADAKKYTYTGYKNLPSISTAANQVYAVTEAGKTYASTVFIIQSGNISNATSDYIFVFGTAAKSAVSTDIDGTYYTMANVLVNGEKQTVSMDNTGRTLLTGADDVMYINPQYDSNGLLTGADAIDGAKYVLLASGITSGTAISQSGSVMTIAGNSIQLAENAKIIVIDDTTVKDTTADNVSSLVKKFTATGEVYIIYDNVTDKNVTTLIVSGN